MEKKQTKFIILSMRRTGSNNLSYLLNSHPQILSIGEVFCLEKVWGEPGKKWMNNSKVLKVIRDLFPVLFLKIFVFNKSYKSNKAVGFRFFYEHANQFKSIVKYFYKIDNLRIIHLRRKNLLENFVSLKLARETGAWSTLRKEKYGNKKVRVDYLECIDHFKLATKNARVYEKRLNKFPILNVYYEDLYESPEREIKKILIFLDLSCLKLTSPLKKQNKRKMSDIVINYSEIKKKFKKTKWANYFKY